MPDRRETREPKMVTVCIHLPPIVVEVIDLLVERGIFPTRSAAIRTILTHYAPKVIQEYDLVMEFVKAMGVSDIQPAPDPQQANGMEKMLSFKVTPAQRKMMVAMAKYYSNGNLSELVRTALDHLYREHFIPALKMMQRE